MVERLREGLSEGRIEIEEFRARLDALFAARTRGDALRVTRDLPLPRPSTSPRRRRGIRRWRTFLKVNAVLWALWVAQVLNGGSPHDLWPLWVTIPWGVYVAI
jgi:hypothetical protein